MSDDDRLYNARTRGIRAAELLEDELLNETLQAMKASYVEALLALPPGDHGLENLHRMATLVDNFKIHLHRVLQQGKLAQRELDDLIMAGQRKRWGII